MGQVLKNANGHIIGEIKEEGGKLNIYNEHGHKMGTYDAKTNTTYNENGHKIGTGNLLTTLL